MIGSQEEADTTSTKFKANPWNPQHGDKPYDVLLFWRKNAHDLNDVKLSVKKT